MSRGCDESALAGFFALAAAGDLGWGKVMSIAHKLFKKESGGYAVDCVSRYIASMTKDAMARST